MNQLPAWWPSDKPWIIADCLDLMRKMPDKCVDLVLTDPPYNWSHKNVIDRTNWSKKGLARKAPVDMNFGEWDYQTEKELTDFTNKWVKESLRILKPNGWLVSWYPKEEMLILKNAIKSSNGYWKGMAIWHKTNPVPNFRKRSFTSSIESFGYALKTKNNHFIFNFTTQKEMHNFFESSICMGNERTKHPTQKPLWITKELISILTNEGDIVFDCFLGSGTLIDACLNTNRIGLGCEINPDYEAIIRKRSMQNIAKLEMF
jgi:DNA modification methylase